MPLLKEGTHKVTYIDSTPIRGLKGRAAIKHRFQAENGTILTYCTFDERRTQETNSLIKNNLQLKAKVTQETTRSYNNLEGVTSNKITRLFAEEPNTAINLIITPYLNEFNDIRFSWEFQGSDSPYPKSGQGAGIVQLNRLIRKHNLLPEKGQLRFKGASI